VSHTASSDVISTAITSLFDIAHPILSAPMGDTAGGKLAAAVSRAGALGMVGGGYAYTAWLERELADVDDERVGIGFITFALDERPEALRVALDAHPVAIQLSFGDPRPHADAIHANGTPLICGTQTIDDVERALEAGADVILAHGRDAGGHGRPVRGTMALIPSVVDRAGDVPVVAAGGIVDGRGLAAALMLGAAGVSMGTRFFASAEAIANQAERDGLVASVGDDTTRTSVFDVIRGPAWPDGHDGRVVRNRLVNMYVLGGRDPAARERMAEEFRASASDDYSMRPLWAGEGLDLIRDIPSAGSIVEQIAADAAMRIRSAQGLLRGT
jgi:nitronate monooxygenase